MAFILCCGMDLTEVSYCIQYSTDIDRVMDGCRERYLHGGLAVYIISTHMWCEDRNVFVLRACLGVSVSEDILLWPIYHKEIRFSYFDDDLKIYVWVHLGLMCCRFTDPYRGHL